MITSIVLVFVALLAIGAPIAMCLTLGAIVPLTFFSDISAIAVIQKFFTSIDSASLMAVPFFIVAGGLLSEGGVSKRLVDFAYSLVGWLPGGGAGNSDFCCFRFLRRDLRFSRSHVLCHRGNLDP